MNKNSSKICYFYPRIQRNYLLEKMNVFFHNLLLFHSNQKKLLVREDECIIKLNDDMIIIRQPIVINHINSVWIGELHGR